MLKTDAGVKQEAWKDSRVPWIAESLPFLLLFLHLQGGYAEKGLVLVDPLYPLLPTVPSLSLCFWVGKHLLMFHMNGNNHFVSIGDLDYGHAHWSMLLLGGQRSMWPTLQLFFEKNFPSEEKKSLLYCFAVICIFFVLIIFLEKTEQSNLLLKTIPGMYSY